MARVLQYPGFVFISRNNIVMRILVILAVIAFLAPLHSYARHDYPVQPGISSEVTDVHPIEEYGSSPAEDCIFYCNEVSDTCRTESSYVIEVTSALPSGRGQVFLNSSYSLKISENAVDSALPYFGRAYNVPYGGGDGLFFSAVPEEYSELETKSGQRKITFKVRANADLFSFSVTLDCPDGVPDDESCTAFITVSSGQRQSISYRGHLVRQSFFSGID